MKVYKIECCEGYRWGYYSNDNSWNILDADKMLNNENFDLGGSIPFKFDFCNAAHLKKHKKPGDFMYTNLVGLWAVNERAKEIISKKYGDFLRFIFLDGTDEYGNKYYSFLPTEYIDCLDAERSVFYEDRDRFRLFEGIHSLNDISKYCFKDIVPDHPVFRIKQSGYDKNNGKRITVREPFYVFVREDFVRYVKDNDLTGFAFKEVYDSDDFAPDRKAAEAALNIKKEALRIYRVSSVGDNREAAYSEYNSMERLKADALLGEDPIVLNGSLPFDLYFHRFEHPDTPWYDHMDSELENLILVSERAKNILQSSYGSFLRFFPAKITDDREHKYYAMIPLECIDFFNVDRKNIGRDHKIPEESEDRVLYMGTANKYKFGKHNRNYPVFRIKESCFAWKKAGAVNVCDLCSVYVLEEFVQLAKDNDLTGFEFKKVYDSESADFTEEIISIPAVRKKQAPRKKRRPGEYNIPLRHETGRFMLCEVDTDSPGEDCLVIQRDGSTVTNSANRYTAYNVGILAFGFEKDTEVIYSGGRLESVYVNSYTGRTPVYLSFDFSSGSDPEDLTRAVNECAALCAAELLIALKTAKTPIGPLALECFCDGEAYCINLQDSDGRIYPVEGDADSMLCCLCICAEEQCTYNECYGYEIFDRILNGLRKRLSVSIPEKFEVSADFEISEPEMYD